MIKVGIETGLDRYLTESLTRTFDRRKVRFFQAELHRRSTRAHHVLKLAVTAEHANEKRTDRTRQKHATYSDGKNAGTAAKSRKYKAKSYGPRSEAVARCRRGGGRADYGYEGGGGDVWDCGGGGDGGVSGLRSDGDATCVYTRRVGE